MSKHTALSATVTLGTAYQVAEAAATSPTSTHTALPANVSVGGTVTVTPGVPD